MLEWSRSLMSWYTTVKRDLPWRNTADPYQIWLSEVILQQTRVAQGLPYFERFVAKYPTVQELAAAPEQEVLRLWQGLGYYSRARNLHHAAKQVVAEFGGQFPNNYRQLRQLKGVGPYTAAAIASIAFGEAVPVVDGNVYRVLSRVFGEKTPIDSSQAHQVFSQLAGSLLPARDAGDFNQALMEFGALQCVPVAPSCESCIFAGQCHAYLKDEVKLLPIKVGKVKVRRRYFNYVVFKQGAGLYLRHRPAGDIWQHLYDFELLEADHLLNEAGIVEHLQQKFQFLPEQFRLLAHSEPVKHVLTHQRIEAKFWLVQIFHNLHTKELKFVPVNDMEQYPLPRLIETTLKQHYAWLD